jgi:ribA/ribD-fused uncharacterized protein
MRITQTHVYFFSDNDYLSNFFPAVFTLDDLTYSCVEQYIMAQKAILFNDMESFEAIMVANKPSNMKKIGRKVANFNEKIWLANRNKILQDGIMAKFEQNENINKMLLATNNLTLVEASPYDKIYGVGLSEKDDRILDESEWKGINLLGRTLELVRSELVRSELVRSELVKK